MLTTDWQEGRTRGAGTPLALGGGYNVLRKFTTSCCCDADSAWKACDAALPWPSCSEIAVGKSAARPSCRKIDLARRPHSGAVRIMVGSAAPDVIPSPSAPMLCSRKSPYGWKVCCASAWLTVELIGVPPVEGGMNDAGFEAVLSDGAWHPAHPSCENSSLPRNADEFCGIVGGGASARMKSVKRSMSARPSGPVGSSMPVSSSAMPY